ncbi:MAG: hypothetical protein BGO12_18390 [Verrucomicrobia bacterium 61-8]|nr:MAG: hypothetical protein BGO12_18390 [Verrucomicrobia bacterium 61-8]
MLLNEVAECGLALGRGGGGSAGVFRKPDRARQAGVNAARGHLPPRQVFVRDRVSAEESLSAYECKNAQSLRPVDGGSDCLCFAIHRGSAMAGKH